MIGLLRRFAVVLAGIAFVVCFWFLHPLAINAATTFTVTTINDNTTTDTVCTLREAILTANGTPANEDCGADAGAPYTIGFTIAGGG